MKHRPVRVWWRPWAQRCVCGCAWFPCPDSIKTDRAGADPQTMRNSVAHWNDPKTLEKARNERRRRR
ncbi:MAG: hypothetical protein ABW000_18870 [Actinoplanes sp.]